MTFDEGKDFCNELDSDLLQLDTRLKNEFILGQIKQDSWIGSYSSGEFNYKWIASQRKFSRSRLGSRFSNVLSHCPFAKLLR